MPREKPEEKYNITGKGLTPEKREMIDYCLEELEADARKPIEGEFKKTPDQLKIIKRVNEHLNEEFKELGLKRKADISPEQIHFLPNDVYEKRFPHHIGYAALNRAASKDMFVDLSLHPGRKKLYNSILHEVVHLDSVNKHSVNGSCIHQTRSGYLVSKERGHEHLRGLDEMIVDKVTYEIAKKHVDKLAKEFKFSKQEKKSLFYGYDLTMLETIIERIAVKNKEEREDVWKRFKKGLFTGEMMHLRDIERTFGKGSLRVISALYSGTRDIKIGIDRENYDKMMDYVKTDDEEKRDRIAQEILIDREYKEYKKQRENKNIYGE